MSDPRTILERTAERIAPKSDAFERLERRRSRMARNRRITAGVVAMLVAVAGSYAAFTVFRGSRGSTVAGASEGFHALWPEQTLGAAQEAQARVDAGAADEGWRLDAASVAARFVSEQLGWDQPLWATLIQSGGTDTGPVSVQVSTLPVPCPIPCPPELEPRTEVVVMERLVGEAPNGIWSVTEVYDPALPLRLPLSAGQTVVSGQSVTLPIQVPEGDRLDAGYTYLYEDDCGAGSFTNTVEPQIDPGSIDPGGIGFTVADMSFEQSCEPGQAASIGGSRDENGADLNLPLDGYVYVALFAPDAAQDAAQADPFAVSSPPQGADIPLAIAAVPVHFVPVGTVPEAEAAPNVVSVGCEQGTILDSDAVQPQLDGVHVDILEGGRSAAVEIRGDTTSTTLSTGLNVVAELVPGDYQVFCSGDQGVQTLHVVDPQGVYVSPELSSTCSTGTGSGVTFPEGAVGEQGDPVEITKEHLQGLQDGDVVERAGYPASADPTVRVTRGGEVIASFHFISDGQSGWLQDSSQQCSDAGLSYPDAGLSSAGAGAPSPAPQLPTCEPNAGANGGPNGTKLHLVSQNLSFDTDCLNAPAGKAFTILFDNLDAGVPKNVSIYPCSTVNLPAVPECVEPQLDAPLFTGEIIIGTGQGIEIVYELGPLKPGVYYFQDDVHPTSNGVLIVS